MDLIFQWGGTAGHHKKYGKARTRAGASWIRKVGHKGDTAAGRQKAQNLAAHLKKNKIKHAFEKGGGVSSIAARGGKPKGKPTSKMKATSKKAGAKKAGSVKGKMTRQL